MVRLMMVSFGSSYFNAFPAVQVWFMVLAPLGTDLSLEKLADKADRILKMTHPQWQLFIHPMQTGISGLVPIRLFYITDCACGLCFLVDTDAEVSIIPPTNTERKYPHASLTLQVVNNSRIATFGTRSLSLDISLRRTFHWILVLVDVEKLILGADLLCHFNILVDMRQIRLFDALTQCKFMVSEPKEPHPVHLSCMYK